MPEIIIDDKKVSFSGKANVMQLAKSVGIKIPGFCYHPGLSVSGNCRMCLVEVGMPARDKDGSLLKDENGKIKINFLPKLQPACYQEPADGMVIRTNTEKVVTNRKHIMEFLLANHPLDCPVCDQSGECVLQDYAFKHGFSESRFHETKRTFSKIIFSDVITPELNRCIHCDRCSRFTTEIAKELVFCRTGRGNSTRLATLPGEKITHNYQGNMVDICPVGALTLTDFRFKSRVWFLKDHDGICTSCGKGCNVIYSVDKNNQVLRIKPRHNESINSYWMCDFGRLDYRFFNENRQSDCLDFGEKVNLAHAFEKAASMILSAQSVGVIASANESNESLAALVKFIDKNLKANGKNVSADFKIHSAQLNEDRSLKTGEILMVNDPYPNSEGARKSGLVSGSLSAVEMLKDPSKVDVLLLILDDKAANNREVTDLAGKSENGKIANLIILSPLSVPLNNYAAAVIPLPSAIEQSGTFINVDGVAQNFNAAIPMDSTKGPEKLAMPELLEELEACLKESEKLKKSGVMV